MATDENSGSVYITDSNGCCLYKLNKYFSDTDKLYDFLEVSTDLSKEYSAMILKNEAVTLFGLCLLKSLTSTFGFERERDFETFEKYYRPVYPLYEKMLNNIKNIKNLDNFFGYRPPFSTRSELLGGIIFDADSKIMATASTKNYNAAAGVFCSKADGMIIGSVLADTINTYWTKTSVIWEKTWE
jgi:hypothetical protein